jgi:hypothetical protein
MKFSGDALRCIEAFNHQDSEFVLFNLKLVTKSIRRCKA